MVGVADAVAIEPSGPSTCRRVRGPGPPERAALHSSFVSAARDGIQHSTTVPPLGALSMWSVPLARPAGRIVSTSNHSLWAPRAT
jgi:hypothetical protein